MRGCREWRAAVIIAVVLGSVIGESLPASAATAAWEQFVTTTSPTARYGHAMAFDSARGRTVLYAGSSTSTGWKIDIWERHGTSWIERFAPTRPVARWAPAMAYDAARRRTVLFGGVQNDTKYGDTWEWDGTAWTRPTPAVSPPARYGHAMVYDAARERVVLFGGQVGTNNQIVADTWEWDGANWTQRSPATAPPARQHHRMSYDADRERTVLFGGWGYGSGDFADTWEWDGTNWVQRTPEVAPPRRSFHAMSYDAARSRTVLFGGSPSGGPTLADTWEWDGAAWAQRLPSISPSLRWAHAMVYDSSRARTVLFGGTGSSGEKNDTWEFSSLPPDTQITAAPASPTNELTSELAFTSNVPAEFECALDGSVFVACTSPATYQLAEGSHSFAVRAIDVEGEADATSAVHLWIIDRTAPDTSIDSGPSGIVDSTSAAISFSATESGSTFACSLDGAPFSACTSSASLTDLAQGAHTFEVRATDAAGNTDPTPAVRSWTVDTIAPETSITDGPSGVVATSSASFSFSSDDAASSFECSFDGAPFASCTSPATSTGLAEGAHVFKVRARDDTGNVDATPASRPWTVDTVAPDTSIDSGPSEIVTSTSATISFSATESGSTFACSLDGAAFAACTSPVSLSDLAQGAHTFEVRATDAAGNTDPTPAVRSWTVDTISPDTSILAGPAGVTGSKSATFTFTSSEPDSAFACSIDGGAFSSCTSPKSFILPDGLHTFAVRATDAAGNTDATPAARTWRIDTSAPVVALERPVRGIYVADQRVAAPVPFPMLVGAVRVEARASDAESGIAGVVFFVDGRSVPASSVGSDPAEGRWWFTYQGDFPGRHVIAVRASNGVGRSADAETEVWVLAP